MADVREVDRLLVYAIPVVVSVSHEDIRQARVDAVPVDMSSILKKRGLT